MLRLPDSLNDIDVQPRYVSGVDDIVNDFIVPCMSVATQYSRTSGFFSSAVLAVTWRGIRRLIENNGTMRVVCSPILASADIEALAGAVESKEDEFQERALLEDFQSMMASPDLLDSARALAALVVTGKLEVRIAMPVHTSASNFVRRIFHQKTGIFGDRSGNLIAFNGSMNETAAGLSRDGNIESFQAFVSWQGDREAMRVSLEVCDFEDLWHDRFFGVSVRPLPEAIERALLTSCADLDLHATLDILAQQEECVRREKSRSYQLRLHQAQVLDSWEAASHRGIVKHATGSGKTITAIEAIRRSVAWADVVLILVPSVLLQRQWESELTTWGPIDSRILLCGGGNDRWRSKGTLARWTDPEGGLRIIIAILATASKPTFIEHVKDGSHVLVVADEVHRTGAAQYQSVLNIEAGGVLGLSATPERAGDPEGTSAIFRYFGGLLEPEYGLRDAIRDGVLTPYYYSPSVVELTTDEQVEWNGLSTRISQLAAREDRSIAEQARLENLLILRSRIAKQAENKTTEAVRIVTDEYEVGQRWLVYCDTTEQMQEINGLLVERGVDSHVYYSGMGQSKAPTLDYFESIGGVLVSIRCLDEGVDIPAASHALLLASSRNPREFIQRRGRVLRRFPGKLQSRIFDVLVAPSSDRETISLGSAGPLVGDIARAMEFAQSASNPYIDLRLKALAISYGMSPEELARAGFEVDHEEGDDA